MTAMSLSTETRTRRPSLRGVILALFALSFVVAGCVQDHDPRTDGARPQTQTTATRT